MRSSANAVRYSQQDKVLIAHISTGQVKPRIRGVDALLALLAWTGLSHNPAFLPIHWHRKHTISATRRLISLPNTVTRRCSKPNLPIPLPRDLHCSLQTATLTPPPARSRSVETPTAMILIRKSFSSTSVGGFFPASIKGGAPLVKMILFIDL